MTRELISLSAGRSADPIADVAEAVIAVARLNGHNSGDDEIRELLTAKAVEPSSANVALVRAYVARARS